MEPPPRRDKNVTIVFRKLQEAHTDCFNKKHQLELEFLTRVRSYCKQRSEAENEYGQTLTKLAQQCQISEQQAHDLGYSNRSLYAVWNGFLDNSRKTGKQHMDLAKFFSQNIADNLKISQTEHLEVAKKAFERLSRIHHEIQLTAKDVDRFKREYHQAQTTGTEASSKAVSLGKKLKKGLKQKEQWEYEKSEAKSEEASKTATDRRNLCLLYTEALRAHQDRYRTNDLPMLVKEFEQELYSQVWTYLSTVALLEQEMYKTLGNSLDTVQNDIQQAIAPEEHSQVFINSDRALRYPVRVLFEPDICSSYTIGESAAADVQHSLINNRETEENLNQESRKWLASVARHKKTSEDMQQKLKQFQNLRQHAWDAQKSSQGTKSVAAMAELNREIETVSETIRKEETSLIKAEAILQVFRRSGVSLDVIQNSAIYSTSPMYNVGFSSRSSQLSLCSSTSSSDYSTYGKHYKVLYNYIPVQDDELALKKGEELLIIENPSDLEWPKAKNVLGQLGVVPINYIEMATLQESVEGNVTPVQEVTPTEQERPKFHLPPLSPKPVVSSNEAWCEALMDNDGDIQQELNFHFEDYIKIIDKQPHGVDDGYWLGEHRITGQRGIFASLMVRELTKQEISTLFGSSQIKLRSPPALPPKPAKQLSRKTWGGHDAQQASNGQHGRFLTATNVFRK